MKGGPEGGPRPASQCPGQGDRHSARTSSPDLPTTPLFDKGCRGPNSCSMTCPEQALGIYCVLGSSKKNRSPVPTLRQVSELSHVGAPGMRRWDSQLEGALAQVGVRTEHLQLSCHGLSSPRRADIAHGQHRPPLQSTPKATPKRVPQGAASCLCK